MKKAIKIISLIALLLVTAGLLASCSSTDAEWELSPNGQYLEETARYNESYELTYTLVGYGLAGELVEFWNDAYSEEYGYLSVYAVSEDPSVLLLVGYDTPIFVYTLDGAPASLESFISGVADTHRIVNSRDTSSYLDLSREQMNAYDSLEPSVNIPVASLARALTYELKVYDLADGLMHTHGGFYAGDGKLYYINYDALDNSYFDADGNFSYRSGNVPCAVVEGELADRVLDATNYVEGSEIKFTMEEGEREEEDIEADAAAARVLLIFYLAFFLIFPSVIPLVFMIVDLCRRGFRGVSTTTYIILGAILVIFAASIAMMVIVF